MEHPSPERQNDNVLDSGIEALSPRIRKLEQQREEDAVAREDFRVEASCQADVPLAGCDQETQTAGGPTKQQWL